MRKNNDPSAPATGNLQPNDGRGAKEEKGRTWIQRQSVFNRDTD